MVLQNKQKTLIGYLEYLALELLGMLDGGLRAMAWLVEEVGWTLWTIGVVWVVGERFSTSMFELFEVKLINL